MNDNYFTKQVDATRKPLTGRQRAALLFSLLGRDGFESLTPYLSDKEIQLLRKSMKSIKNRIDVEEDVSVLESLRKYGEATNLWPEKQHPDSGYTKGYFETHSQYQPPVQENTPAAMGIKSEDIARVLSMWLQDDE